MGSNNKMGKLYVISGPSGTGKGTICHELLQDMYNDFSVSMTTRAPRDGEVEGRHYFFVSREDFEENIEKGNFLEYANVYGNMYGTPKDAVIKRLERGHNVILDIDVQGALQVKSAYPEAILIFILPPDMDELRKRLTGRDTDAPEVIEKRLAEAIGEIKFMGEYDYYIVNDNLEEAIAEARAILKAESLKTPKHVKSIISKYE